MTNEITDGGSTATHSKAKSVWDWTGLESLRCQLNESELWAPLWETSYISVFAEGDVIGFSQWALILFILFSNNSHREYFWSICFSFLEIPPRGGVVRIFHNLTLFWELDPFFIVVCFSGFGRILNLCWIIIISTFHISEILCITILSYFGNIKTLYRYV